MTESKAGSGVDQEKSTARTEANASNPLPPGMLLDSTGLGFTSRGGRIAVHYPRVERATKEINYGAGFDIGETPSTYWTTPPNEITAERVEIWRRLVDA